MTSARSALRLCHAGMEGRTLDAFQIFLSRVDAFSCRITDENHADAAFIDADGDLGQYLLEGHRLLYPGRPMIVTSSRPTPNHDPFTIQVTKPVGLAAFSAALQRVHELLPRSRDDGRRAPQPPFYGDLGAPPDDLPAFTDAVEAETIFATRYVGSAPDVDLDDPRQRERIYYLPENFLQGTLARALAHARDVERPVKLRGPLGTILYLDPTNESAYQPLSPKALRAQAQVPTRGTIKQTTLDAGDVGPVARLDPRPLQVVEWEVALWASRGRLPRGTDLDTPVRLVRWPNFTRLPVPEGALRIAGLWSRTPTTLRDTVHLLGLPQRHVFAFFSACAALDLLQLGDEGVPDRRGTGDPARTPERRGLLQRTLGRLLGARPDERPDPRP
ncbi:MAG TPA: hypothetical protein PKX01_04355 [Rhodocyclaceae bacterium]|uniref:hypothetical protein n=1 Tax=Zoogloea sp. TaxID=49181 RepID=UPI002CB1C031|nr:hypothetical protein [Zoogloea sp.]HMW52953.1 hypothetical protein [Rhodocyclaceae bacterium]HMY50603.1 hypothetical protein [Rhodocyclaceae bacterium]HMZ75387.1 hypothetical protein [Rhodocyclaceae bacterium]HNA68088.1 hypothetical protein [Rhodocyclaceae bacterium]HNC78119.1 hypothetical protein [Rhodocyclaceae bacterium]